MQLRKLRVVEGPAVYGGFKYLFEVLISEQARAHQGS